MDGYKFSVIITCYNEEKFISETIDSVLHQTRIDLINEIVVVDDGSKDSSKEKVLEKAKENAKVKYIYQENRGVAGARNTGINNSTGDYIAILGGDDLWMENKIEIVERYAKEYPQVGLFYSNTYKYGDQKNKLIPLRVNKYYYDQFNLLQTFLAKGGPIVPSSAVIKKECFETLGIFDENFRMAEDTDMWLRIATKYPFHHIEEYLVKKRTVENSVESNTLENAKYYKMAFDKIESLVPALKPYRAKRDILIHYNVGLYYYNIQKWKLARKEAKKAIVKGKTFFKAYVLWGATLIKRFFPILNPRILSREDIIKKTRLPILSEIGHNKNNQIVADQLSRSLLAKQFGILKTKVQFILREKNQKVIMVTSSMGNEGKSFISVNLANALASEKNSVLLMELDLRKPKILKYLNILSRNGLSNYLSSDSSVEEIIIPSGLNENLFIAGSGAIPPNPTELLLSPRLANFFATVKKQFDYIIIDSPPIGLLTDGKIISKYANATLYIIREKFTLRNQLNIIQGITAKINNLYVLINDMKEKSGYSRTRLQKWLAMLIAELLCRNFMEDIFFGIASATN